MKIGLLQENFIVGDFEGNAAKIEESIHKLLEKDSQIDIFITSEMSLWGYPPQDLLCIPQKVIDCQKVLEDLCKKLAHTCFLVGLATTKSGTGKGLYNSMALCRAGKIEQLFHKCLLPNYDVFDDTRYFDSAKNCGVFEFAGKKIGVAICEDLCYEKKYNLSQNYSQGHLKNFTNLDLLLNPSASPYYKGKILFRKKYIQEISQKLKCPILFLNQVGGNDSLVFDGSSFLATATAIHYHLDSFCEKQVIIDLEKKSQHKNKKLSSCEEVSSAIILGIRDYFCKTGYQKAVLGLSGGIDSALTLFFAVKSLGKKNVTCLLMPSPYSSDHSITDAKKLAENLEVSYEIIVIKEMMDSFHKALYFILKDTEKNETEENIQTRIRGILLMAYANKKGRLLLTTGNKSEIFAGYCTLYGDMCGALNPLGDLTKQQVYEISHYFQKKENIFPYNILTKAPSAELRENQTDQDSLPPYEKLDKILEKIVIENQTKADLKQNFSKDILEKSYRLFSISEYKRKQAPPILKVSKKAFDTGWRIPIAKKI